MRPSVYSQTAFYKDYAKQGTDHRKKNLLCIFVKSVGTAGPPEIVMLA